MCGIILKWCKSILKHKIFKSLKLHEMDTYYTLHSTCDDSQN